MSTITSLMFYRPAFGVPDDNLVSPRPSYRYIFSIHDNSVDRRNRDENDINMITLCNYKIKSFTHYLESARDMFHHKQCRLLLTHQRPTLYPTIPISVELMTKQSMAITNYVTNRENFQIVFSLSFALNRFINKSFIVTYLK